MAKVPLTSVVSLQDNPNAVTALNNNFAAIQAAFENTFSRDGTSPNQLLHDVDANSKRIINLPQPLAATDAARLTDIQHAALGNFPGLNPDDVRLYGAQGIGSAFDDSVSVNARVQALKPTGAVKLYFPYTAGGYYFQSGIDLTGCSHVHLYGDPGTVLRAAASLNGSNNSTKNDLIYALNFTGSAGATGYAQRHIYIHDLTLDCYLMSASAIPAWDPLGTPSFGRSLAAIEIMNVDYATVKRVKVMGAYGNGVVLSTQDPRLFNDAGQNNGIIEPVIEDVYLVDCIRGQLPQYGSTLAPLGITGSAIQIGACLGGRIKNIYARNIGGPLTDTFNTDSLVIEDVVVDGISGTPVGSNAAIGTVFQQTVGTLHSDFGMRNCRIRNYKSNNAGGIILGGFMGLFVFNDNVPTAGPQNCTIEDVVLTNPAGALQVTAPAITGTGVSYNNPYTLPISITFLTLGTGLTLQYRRGATGSFGAMSLGLGSGVTLYAGDAIKLTYTAAPTWIWNIAPNLGNSAIQLSGGSITGTVGLASGNVVRNVRITLSGEDGIDLYDAANNSFDNIVIDKPGVHDATTTAVTLNAQIAQVGGGSFGNSFTQLTVTDNRRTLSNPVQSNDIYSINSKVTLSPSRAAISDASYSQVLGVKTITYQTLTASRVVTLIAAATVAAGDRVSVLDGAGACSFNKIIAVVTSGSDTISGPSSTILNAPFDGIVLESDGISKWTLISRTVPPANMTVELRTSVVTDDALVIGMPVAISQANGHGVLARSDTYAKSLVLGLASNAASAAGFVAVVAGSFTLADWTAVTGAADLSFGLPYWLSTTGGLTTTRPTTAGQSTAFVGTAVSARTLMVIPQPPSLL